LGFVECHAAVLAIEFLLNGFQNSLHKIEVNTMDNRERNESLPPAGIDNPPPGGRWVSELNIHNWFLCLACVVIFELAFFGALLAGLAVREIDRRARPSHAPGNRTDDTDGQDVPETEALSVGRVAAWQRRVNVVAIPDVHLPSLKIFSESLDSGSRPITLDT
jgi:hypothetical protein